MFFMICKEGEYVFIMNWFLFNEKDVDWVFECWIWWFMIGFVGRFYGNVVMFLCNMVVRLNFEVIEEVGVRINCISNDKDIGFKS